MIGRSDTTTINKTNNSIDRTDIASVYVAQRILCGKEL